MLVNVLIPNPESSLMGCDIAKGSAIVASEYKDGVRRVYYEGNIYGACNLNLFEDRLLVASYRLKDKAPTTSFTVDFGPDSQQFVKVGQYDLDTKELSVSDQKALDDWTCGYSSFDS